MNQDVYELVIQGHALGAQGACVGQLNEEAKGRKGQQLEAIWATECGTLNRVISLWKGEPAPVAEVEAAQDWLSQGRVSRRLVERRPLCRELLNAPFVDMRTYAPHAGRFEEFIETMTKALRYREQYSPCAGLWASRERGVDIVVHFWPYDSLEHRLDARRSAATNADWTAYRKAIEPMIAAMQAALIVPVTTGIS
jgi:hypothetical protein